MNNHYFIGIKTPSSIEDTVRFFREKYNLSTMYKAIPHTDDLHITLLFIGALSEERIADLVHGLTTVASQHTKFNLSVSGLSYFGSPKGPRVVYLSVEPSSELEALQESIAAIGRKDLGIESDKRFTPHITIAKKRKLTSDFTIPKESYNSIEFNVDGFSLFTIHPSKTPKYEIIEHFSFK
ncbi:RNA 2',3'-cyclic phosphodiesterase [Sporosarcina thermotolerans]|uniref:RNA 2',3'-cyclic phosphodiesterase n=1 Tax=Sporosarcina thermotolerans TaxID=633404 RepID=A0AAW9A6U0_9BACL|nr:RNA 2',3'-cyclic phosphodiesterase [Sporosarcina thermotolerans]MDW0117062.1 RNA 2',3'-cyclic phosphodiesterase [Sporosarcina thermotolerans]WHT47836.1 RNA 2',3'-cyclic phosphodiesterase [Sporosarcina thermotolerans]